MMKRLSAVLTGLAVLTPSALLAQDTRDLATTCWTTEALAGQPREKPVTKGDKRFDTPPASSTLHPFSAIAPELRGAIRRVKLATHRKLIALTFDLCETNGEVAGYDGAIIDYLRQHKIKATLFTGGKWMRSHPVRTQQLIADPLFEMANHADAHRNLRLLSGDQLNAEINGPQQAYEAARASLSVSQCFSEHKDSTTALAPRMTLFRFPFGACHQASLDAVNNAGLLAIQWDLSTGDPAPKQSADAIASAMIKRTKPGSILIGHANGRGHNTAAALPIAIPQLQAQGYEFVTVSELLAAGTPEITSTCYDSRPGDTDKYDTFFSRPRPAPENTNVPGSPVR
jgi:peptidoglycan-N-acetylglucosamine deacetylase